MDSGKASGLKDNPNGRGSKTQIQHILFPAHFGNELQNINGKRTTHQRKSANHRLRTVKHHVKMQVMELFRENHYLTKKGDIIKKMEYFLPYGDLCCKLKREAGEIPARSRHCNEENPLITTVSDEKREGKRFVDSKPGDLPWGRAFNPTGNRRVLRFLILCIFIFCAHF